jgi:hypothetical protein
LATPVTKPNASAQDEPWAVSQEHMVIGTAASALVMMVKAN